jgi:phage tail sheath protein FI
LETADIDSSYYATYFPWIQVSDTVNNKNIMLPPTLEVCKSIAYNDNVAFPWYAPAGLNRGVTDAADADETYSQADRDILYDGRINPLAKFNGTGVAIWGQKTLQIRESALDRINVRRLILELKVLITNVAVRLLFEQNDQATIDEFLTKVNPLLDSVKRERGLQEFKVVMDSSNNSPESRDRNELYGTIQIKPTRSVEYIGLEFQITPTGASFADQ